eukprot:1772984-Pyramimonas_sp.AAC.1
MLRGSGQGPENAPTRASRYGGRSRHRAWLVGHGPLDVRWDVLGLYADGKLESLSPLAERAPLM